MPPGVPALRDAVLEFADNPTNSSLPRALGFTPLDHAPNLLSQKVPFAEAVKDAASHVHKVGTYETPQGSAALYVVRLREWGLRSSDRDKARRRIARAFVHHPYQEARRIIALIPSEEDWKRAKQRDVEFVIPKVREKGDIATVRALVAASEPSRFHLDLLKELALTPGMELPAVARHWSEAFSVERVTTAFYKEFEQLRDRFVDLIQKSNAKHPLLGGKDNTPAVARFATRQLGRVLFAWFLQGKKWLDEDDQYLSNKYEEFCRNSKKNYFLDVLLPLFFQALAHPPGSKERGDSNALLGAIPYLNGGLFMPTEFEDELFGTDLGKVRKIDVPNELFDPRSRKQDGKGDYSVLGLLCSYRFTTRESTPDDMSVDPDPELLGKVFENLNEIGERHDTGTYYTPREIVRFMCREAIDGYLCDEAQVEPELLERIRRAAVETNEDEPLDKDSRKRLDDAIERVTICDPAVGSGAFLVGAMQELVLLRKGIMELADGHPPQAHEVAEWKRRIISHNLYGVDINPGAIEICRLRLWLSLVLEEEQPSKDPLPNLDFRIVAGDSLIDRIGDISFEDSLGGETRRLDSKLHGLHDQIRESIAEFQETKHAGHARQRREKVKRLKREAMMHQVQYHIDLLAPGVDKQRSRVSEYEKLKAQERTLKKERKLLDALEGRLTQLIDVQARIEHASSEQAQTPFLWPVEFPEVFDPTGNHPAGFDVVLANPPYVRQEKIPPEEQEAYRHAFQEVHAGTADLLVYFYARAIQVLRPDGFLSFITSNSFVKREYGDGVQGLLAARLRMKTAIDFGETKVFDATVEPYVLVAQHRLPTNDDSLQAHFVYVELMRKTGGTNSVMRVRQELEDLDMLLSVDELTVNQGEFTANGWKIEPAPTIRLYQRLMSSGTPLSAFLDGEMYYGVKTGLNEACVITDMQRRQLLKGNPQSERLIRPWLRGRDVGRWETRSNELFVVAVQNSGDADANNEWGHAKTEREAWKMFQAAHPSIAEHLGTWEQGLRRRADQGRWWWELRACAYYQKFAEPKLIWPDISRTVRFAWDELGSFLDTTVFFAPSQPRWLMAVLNSRIAEFLFCMMTNSVPGGFMRLKMAYIEPFPVVVPSQALQHRLASASDDGSLFEELVAETYALEPEDLNVLDDWFKRRSMSLEPSEVVEVA